MIKTSLAIALALSLTGFVALPGAHAAQPDSTTVLTFDNPVEIPGQVLPAGTYRFTLLDSMTDRHIVQIASADGSQILATVMTIPHYRLDKTDQTVVTYGVVPAGAPAAIRAWYHPNDTVGHEFVYPRLRAVVLAKQANTPVPATVADTADATALKTAPIVAVRADGVDEPVVVATEAPRTATTAPAAPTQETRTPAELPRTASTLPLLLLLGFGCIGTALGLMAFGRRSPASAA